jgi:hypothetical protein
MNIAKFQTKMFDYLSILLYVLYFAVIMGLSVNAPRYIEDLQYYLKIYISLFLIIRFNNFRHIEFTELDRKIAFNAGIFLLSATILDQLVAFIAPKFGIKIQSNKNK